MSALLDLRPGDVVAIQGGLREPKIETVDRLTPTQIILSGGGRYNRVSGDVIGGDRWHRHRISIDPASILVAWRHTLTNTLANIRPHLTQHGIEAARRKLSEAEAFLRQAGEWKDPTP